MRRANFIANACTPLADLKSIITSNKKLYSFTFTSCASGILYNMLNSRRRRPSDTSAHIASSPILSRSFTSIEGCCLLTFSNTQATRHCNGQLSPYNIEKSDSSSPVSAIASQATANVRFLLGLPDKRSFNASVINKSSFILQSFPNYSNNQGKSIHHSFANHHHRVPPS